MSTPDADAGGRMSSLSRWLGLTAVLTLLPMCGRESSPREDQPPATQAGDSAQPEEDPAALERRCKAADYRACALACERKEPRACVVLGEALVEGRTGRVEDARGRSLLEQACRDGAGDGCFALADRFMRSPDRDLATSRRYFARGCELEDWASCVRLADLLRHGRGGPADPEGAQRALERACTGGLQPACGALGGGGESPPPPDDEPSLPVPPVAPPERAADPPPPPRPTERR